VKWGINATLVPTHVIGLMVEETTGARFTFVPFKGGAEMITALAGGIVDVGGASGLVGRPFAEDERIRAIAAVDEGPQDQFPGVTSVKEQGYEAQGQSFYGLILPAGTDPAIIEFWNAAVNDALAAPAVQEKLATAALIALPMTVEEYQAHWQDARSDAARSLEVFATREGN
jgi:tripartite-type tricarboxylate transporter receptor subunit TctC